jgi:hypothetical protein
VGYLTKQQGLGLNAACRRADAMHRLWSGTGKCRPTTLLQEMSLAHEGPNRVRDNSFGKHQALFVEIGIEHI